MTRNEWIAETAARLLASTPNVIDALIVGYAVNLAECLESKGYAPWQSSPPLPDAAAKVVEAAVAWVGKDCGHDESLHLALQRSVRAYKESVK